MCGAPGSVREQADDPASAQAPENSTALAIKGIFRHEMLETRRHLSFNLMQLMTSYLQEMQSFHRRDRSLNDFPKRIFAGDFPLSKFEQVDSANGQLFP